MKRMLLVLCLGIAYLAPLSAFGSERHLNISFAAGRHYGSALDFDTSYGLDISYFLFTPFQGTGLVTRYPQRLPTRSPAWLSSSVRHFALYWPGELMAMPLQGSPLPISRIRFQGEVMSFSLAWERIWAPASGSPVQARSMWLLPQAFLPMFPCSIFLMESE